MVDKVTQQEPGGGSWIVLSVSRRQPGREHDINKKKSLKIGCDKREGGGLFLWMAAFTRRLCKQKVTVTQRKPQQHHFVYFGMRGLVLRHMFDGYI